MATKSDELDEDYEWLDVTDLGSASDYCEACGTPIRFVHRLRNCNGEIRVGVECCKKYLYDIESVKEADAEAKKAAKEEKRLRRYLEDRNAFYRSKGLPEMTWEQYIELLEKNRRKNRG